MNEIEIIQPDDFHHHLRDGEVLNDVIKHAYARFGRVLAMPNIKPPVRNLSDAIAYKERILSHIPEGEIQAGFEVLMTLYLTDKTSPADIMEAKSSGIVHACKLYPAGATTNSEFGVTSMDNLKDVFQCMSDVGMPLCIHGEVVDGAVDVFDREETFIERILRPLVAQFPSLKIIMEHITTSQAVDFVMSAPANVVATITAHHLLYNRNDIFKGGICPHMYCLPVLKRETHRIALVKAAISGNPKFFAGTDSAPHSVGAKESSCGCAGVFTGHAAVELYTEVFDSMNAMEKLEAFLSIHGCTFYDIPINKRKIKLVKKPWSVPNSYPFGASTVVPLRCGEEVQWSIQR